MGLSSLIGQYTAKCKENKKSNLQLRVNSDSDQNTSSRGVYKVLAANL
jgi:hypothetical protein